MYFIEKFFKFLKSLLLPIFFAGIVPSIILFLIERRTLSTLLGDNIAFLIIGVVLFCIGLPLFIYCNVLFIQIGKGTLMPLKKLETQHLVVKGPYKYVRNPMIMAVLLILLSQSFLFSSLFLFFYTFIFFILNAIYIPLKEEKDMKQRFGEEFLKYKQNVLAWIPRITPYEYKNEKDNINS